MTEHLDNVIQFPPSLPPACPRCVAMSVRGNLGMILDQLHRRTIDDTAPWLAELLQQLANIERYLADVQSIMPACAQGTRCLLTQLDRLAP